jgi:CxxC motif-containing protein
MRPAAVLTAGAAHRYVNVDGYMPGKKVVILGSGDIGLIMARRMTLEGAKVLACVEVMPFCGGLARNVVQCLDDFGIPLYLSHTVTDIKGRDRIEQVVVSKVDDKMRPIPRTEMYFDCDKLLLSVGLIPDNELSLKAGIKVDPKSNGTVVHENMETTVEGFFACGNVAHVHDLVDNVTREAEKAGRSAAEYVLSNYYTLWVQNQICSGCGTSTYYRKKGDIVKFLPPSPDGAAFKMGKNEVICTVCPNGCHLKVDVEHDYKVTGNGCPKGKAYGKAEFTNPTRVITSTVKLKAAGDNEALDSRIPVKTSNPIPKTEIMNLMKVIDEIELTERPEIGQVLVRDVLGLDANLIVAKG